MRIVIINLASEKARIKFQDRQFKKLGLVYERFEAIKPKTLPKHIPKSYWQTWERPLRPAERACFLSHYALWQSILDSNRPALILEDDVLLSQFLPKILAELDALGSNPHGFSHLNLEVTNRKKLVSKPFKALLAGKIDLLHLYQDRNGAGAYILWPTGAKTLTEQTQKKSGLVDAVISRTYALNSIQIEPACAVQFVLCKPYGLTSPFQTKSATNPSPIMTNDGPLQYMAYKSKRMISQLKLGWRRLNFLSATRRCIKLRVEDFKF
ncbi:MAG: glycosyltransferase family 25 protein [Robiginitomaculum sp.]|nr:glycosyltransferase family 25 protein [Robiginitomaculum sp.]